MNKMNEFDISNGNVLIRYGQEDIFEMDKTEIANVLLHGKYSIDALVVYLHFNRNYPEYQNVYVPKNEDFGLLYDGEKWTVHLKEKIIDDIYDDKKQYIIDNLDELSQLINLSQNRKNEVKQRFNNDFKIIRNIKKELESTLVNNSTKINIKNSLEKFQKDDDELLN